jgi:hypothetical protein
LSFIIVEALLWDITTIHIKEVEKSKTSSHKRSL